MLACADVDYREREAQGALMLFDSWTASKPAGHRLVRKEGIAEYRPGHFYERELPVLLDLIAQVDRMPETILIDGYVWLGDAHEKGLGAHLYEALGRAVPVVGVAKTSFKGSTFAVPVRRGSATRSLYVTAAGMDPRAAAECVRAMHGPHRIPTLLKEVDRLARDQRPSR